MITFTPNPQSRGQIVHWMLGELGVPYDTQCIGYGEQMKSAEYLAVNPTGKAPTIKHKNALITQGAAICTKTLVISMSVTQRADSSQNILRTGRPSGKTSCGLPQTRE